jgi:hypothetical protein
MEARLQYCHTWSSEWTEVKSYVYCVLAESTTQDQGDKMSTGHASQTESVIVKPVSRYGRGCIPPVHVFLFS